MGRNLSVLLSLALGIELCTAPLAAAVLTVTSTGNSGLGTLRDTVGSASNGDTIGFSLPPSSQITLSGDSIIISNSITIDGTISGGNVVISGDTTNRPFISSGGSVTLSNLTLKEGLSLGGQGGGSKDGGAGGGGAGLGGAFFVDANTTFINVLFLNNVAQGGQGGSTTNSLGGGGGGGGGLGGFGGDGAASDATGAGGGGGELVSESGQPGSSSSGGLGGAPAGGQGGDDGFSGDSGGRYCGGGGGGGNMVGAALQGGSGGFGGGGGGEGNSQATTSGAGGGQGGFGGGGGGSSADSQASQATSTFAGGSGGHQFIGGGAGGGGGAGLGGALFVSSSNTAQLQYDSTATAFSGNIALGGSPGTSIGLGAVPSSGNGLGSDIFVQSSGTLAFTINNTDTLITVPESIYSNGNITLSKAGSGTLVLSGANSYGGSSAVTVGQLTADHNSALGTSSLTLSHNTVLGLTDSISLTNSIALSSSSGVFFDVTTGSGTLAGAITGTGASVTKTGAGTLLLTGNTSYSGGTTISAGTLGLSGSGTLASSGNVIVNGSSTFSISAASSSRTIADLITAAGTTVALGGNTLTFGTSNNTSLLGTISGGGGALIKVGSGTITLSGNNSFDGGIQLNAGQITTNHNNALGSGPVTLASNTVLEMGSGITTSNALSVNNSAAATLSVPTGIGTLSGGIGNAGGILTKTGGGKLVLTGVSTYAQTLIIAEGSCAVNDTFVGSITAEANTAINGLGPIQGTLSMGSGTTLTPGNSIGTLTLGALDLDPNSITQIEFDPSNHSSLSVLGTANLAGTLHLIQNAGKYPSSGSFPIVTAGAINGTFDAITGGLTGYSFELLPSSTQLVLQYFASLPSTIVTSGLHGNVRRFADYLNAHAPFSAEYTTLTTLSGTELYDALNSSSPARNAFGPMVTQQTLFSLSHILNAHLGNQRRSHHIAVPPNASVSFLNEIQDLIVSTQPVVRGSPSVMTAPFTVWINGFVDLARMGQESQNPAFDFISEGVIVGCDYAMSTERLVGGALGYAHSQVEDTKHQGGAQIPYYFVSLYGDFVWDQLYLEAAFWTAFHQIHNCRKVSIADIDSEAKGTINGWQIDPHVELGYDLQFLWSTLEPYVAWDLAVNWEGSFEERGAGAFNMRQNSASSCMLQSEIGVRFCQWLDHASGRFGFKEGLSYINRNPFGSGTVRSAITGSADFVTLTSFTHTQNLAALNLGVLAQVGKKRDVVLSCSYEGQFGSGFTLNEVVVNLGRQF